MAHNPRGNPNIKGGPGRPPGIKNRKTAREIMDAENYNPILEMIILARTTHNENVKMSLNRDLATYYVPRIQSLSLVDLLKLSADAPQIIKSIKIDYGAGAEEAETVETENETEQEEPGDNLSE